MAPNSETLLEAIPSQFSENEKAEVTDVLKRTLPKKRALLEERGFLEALKELEKAGEIDPNYGDTKLLEMLAEKTTKKQEVLKLIKDFRPSVPIIKKFVGRDVDMERILKFLSDIRVSGVNLFGESGVGKTFLAKEVCVKLRDRFEPFLIDLKGTKALKNVYFKILNAFELAPWDYSKERIYNHLQNFKKRTLLYLDNVEQFLSKESEDDQANRKEFLEFLKAIITSKACKTGQLKVFLTSRAQIDEKALKHALFVEYKLESFSKKVSGDLISRRVKDNELDEEQHQAKVKIIGLCRNTAYLLQGAEQLKREYYSSSVQVLEKISAQIEKGVPERFACIGAMFDALPSDHLKEVAVKISLLCCSFSVSTAMKIAEIPSDYDARWDLEMLVNQKIITAEEKDGKRKYDLHELFREFVMSYLCKENAHKVSFARGMNQFSEHFSSKVRKCAGNLDGDFVAVFKKLEKDRPNLEHLIDIITENEIFELLLPSEDLREAGLIFSFFKYLLNNEKRKKLFEDWSRKEGNMLTNAYIKCWEAHLLADMEGIPSGYKTLNQAKRLLDNADSTTPDSEQFLTAKGMYLLCKGCIKYQSIWNTTEKTSDAKKKARILHEALCDLKKSWDIHKRVYGDHTLTARSIDLMGNCYMALYEPEKAEIFYQEAMNMKLKLEGSEKHDDIVHYYNQLSQVHQMMGDKIMEGPFDLKKVMGPLLPFQKRAKIQYCMAVNLLKKGLNLQKELGVCDTEDTAAYQRNLANIYIVLKQYGEALKYAKMSFKTRYNLLGKHPETVRILYLIGVIHEWRKDQKAALQSYEEAFEMEESLPEDNHSAVRKLLCGRLEKMCQKLNRREKLTTYRPRIRIILQIEDHPPSFYQVTAEGTEEPTLSAERRHSDELEVADEATEEEEVQSLQTDDPLPAEETPVTFTEAGANETEQPVHSDPPSASAQPAEYTSVMEQSDLPTFTLPSEDTRVNNQKSRTAVTKILIDEGGGTYDVSRRGIFIEVPSNAFTQSTEITCTVQPEKYSPSPAGVDETLVSNIVELGPNDVNIQHPITVTLMHSGPGRDLGYETIVKTFNKYKHEWEEIEELQDKKENIFLEPYDCDYVQVEIGRMTTLAVVVRLITNRFLVTPDERLIVKSSVCENVTLDFPAGAVDQDINFTIKVLLMPEDILEDIDAYPCPILSIDGFDEVDLKKPVTVQLPQPCRDKDFPGPICLFRLVEMASADCEGQWEDITDEVKSYSDKNDTLIYFKVKRFSVLSGWIRRSRSHERRSLIERLPSAFRFARRTPRSVCFAAYVENVVDFYRFNGIFTIKLLCADNREVSDVTNLELKGFRSLKCVSADERMRPEQKAYINIEGDFQLNDDEVDPLQFQEDERFMKDIDVIDQKKITPKVKPKENEDDQFEGKAGEKSSALIIDFYKTLKRKRRLCRLSVKKDNLYRKIIRKQEENKTQASAFSEELDLSSSTELHFSDDQKRWLVIGICLNKILLPTLRDFVKHWMEKHYTHLKTIHRIDVQSHAVHLVQDGGFILTYGSINNNQTDHKNKSLYDYDVKSALELAKLYLQPFMARFTDLDDSMDMSAVLGVLSFASVFSPDVQELAKKVRQDVRNVWAHCNFMEWNGKKIKSCFHLMNSFLLALKLPSSKEKSIADELRVWEIKGVDLFMGKDVKAKALHFCEVEIVRLSREVERLDTCQKEEAEQVVNTLKSVLKAFERDKEDIYTRIEALEQQGESNNYKMEVMEQKVETLEQKVEDISSSDISLKDAVECFGILITEPKLRDLPEFIVPYIMKCFEDSDTAAEYVRKWQVGGRERFLCHLSTTNQCHHLLDVLRQRKFQSFLHLLKLLIVGQKLVTTPLREDDELKEKVIEIVSNDKKCCWENLAKHLNVEGDIVNKNREETPKAEHQLTSKMLRQWVETLDKKCTLEKIFSALRSCGYKETGRLLAQYTTEKCKKDNTQVW